MISMRAEQLVEEQRGPADETSVLRARVAELERERDHLVAVVDILTEISASLHFTDILRTIARKLGEEAIETLVAAITDDRAATTSEAADLVFHLLVLLADMDLSFDDVIAELDRREGLSGLAEKAARAGDA